MGFNATSLFDPKDLFRHMKFAKMGNIIFNKPKIAMRNKYA